MPLSTFARFEHGTAPLVIAHQEQFPAVTISFNLAPDAALSDAVRVITQAERDIGMPTSVIGSYSGRCRRIRQIARRRAVADPRGR